MGRRMCGINLRKKEQGFRVLLPLMVSVSMMVATSVNEVACIPSHLIPFPISASFYQLTSLRG